MKVREEEEREEMKGKKGMEREGKIRGLEERNVVCRFDKGVREE